MSLQDHRFLKSRPGEIASQKLFQDYDRVLQNNPSYTFLTGIVKDVVSNPYEYLRREFENTGVPLKDVLTGRFKPEIGNPPKQTDVSSNIVNKELIESMPINSIFAYIVDGNKARDKGEYVVCYPFFPPHLSLPLKAGEYVWIITEKIGSLTYYYWMCRKVGSIYVDDLNFTNLERSPAANAMIVQKRKQPNATLDLDEVYSLNEIKDKYNNDIKGAGTTNMPEPLASLFNNSYSHNVEFTGEPVPRLHKDCGDLLFQGSNNAGIHITTEKFASNPLKYQETSANVGGMPNSTPRSSAIDIYVGRKKSSIESARFNRTINSDPDKIGKMAFNVNNSDNPAYEYVENDKFANIRLNDDNVYDSELRDNAGDARDIAARLYLSHDSSPDLIFGSAFDVLSPKFGESIVTFADVNRVVGSQNARMVSIAGESFIDLDTNGNIVLKASIDNGQQFLSLANNGVTRLQARDRIQITQSSNNSDTPEIEITSGNTTITGGDITSTGDAITLTAKEDINVNTAKDLIITADKNINVNAKGITTIGTEQKGGVVVANASPGAQSSPAGVIGTAAIIELASQYYNLPGSAAERVLQLGTLLGPGAAAAPVISAILEPNYEASLLKQLLDLLTTKYFLAE